MLLQRHRRNWSLSYPQFVGEGIGIFPENVCFSVFSIKESFRGKKKVRFIVLEKMLALCRWCSLTHSLCVILPHHRNVNTVDFKLHGKDTAVFHSTNDSGIMLLGTR